MTWPGTWREKGGASGVAGEPVHAPKGERGVRGMVEAEEAEVVLLVVVVVVGLLAALVSTALGVGLVRGEEEEEAVEREEGAGRRRRSDILMVAGPWEGGWLQLVMRLPLSNRGR